MIRLDWKDKILILALSFLLIYVWRMVLGLPYLGPIWALATLCIRNKYLGLQQNANNKKEK
jgi:hypothetical protein